MASRLLSRLARRDDDDRPDTSDDLGVRALFVSARRLVDVLEAGAEEPALGERVADYVRCAAARGISCERMRAALECLVHDHAAAGRVATPGRASAQARRQATAPVLALMLQLASGPMSAVQHSRRRRHSSSSCGD